MKKTATTHSVYMQIKIGSKILLLILLFCIGMVSCENKKTKIYSFKGTPILNINSSVQEIFASNEQTQKLEFSQFEGKELIFTDILDTVKLIPLETSENCIIGEIDKIEVHNGSYFILDKRQTKSLFVFNEDGKFKYSISAEGRGPLEFIMPYDFTINTDLNEIVLCDGRLSKLIFYNIESGKPIREKKLYYRFHNIAYSGKGFFCLSSHNDDNSHLESIENYSLFITDSTFTLKNKFLKKNITSNNYFLRNDLTQKSGVNYAPRFNNKVFNIKADSIHQVYDISFDAIEVEREDYRLQFSELNEITERNSSFYFMGTYVEGATIDFFELESSRKKISVFWDKVNKKLVGGEILTLDPLKLPFYSDPLTSDNDEFISYLDSYALSNIKGSLPMNELKKLPKRFVTLIQDVSADDNPIIIRYKIDPTLNKDNLKRL